MFDLLPEDQRQPFYQLWQEFEARVTPAARFAKALDALQPVLLTWGAGAQGSAAHPELTLKRVLQLKCAALSEFPALLALVERTLAQAVTEGILPTNH